MPLAYEHRFQRAMSIFRHQRVYCPKTKTMVHVRPLPQNGLDGGQNDNAFLGPLLADDIAQGIAEGRRG